MHTIIQSSTPSAARGPAGRASPHANFRKPQYAFQDEDKVMKLCVFIPGVEASGVSIEARGADLVVTAAKTRFVRVNWQSLHLENSQRDYRLSLRLGRSYAYEAMEADMHNGILTITLPKRVGKLPAPAEKGTGGGTLRRVA